MEVREADGYNLGIVYGKFFKLGKQAAQGGKPQATEEEALDAFNGDEQLSYAFNGMMDKFDTQELKGMAQKIAERGFISGYRDKNRVSKASDSMPVSLSQIKSLIRQTIKQEIKATQEPSCVSSLLNGVKSGYSNSPTM